MARSLRAETETLSPPVAGRVRLIASATTDDFAPAFHVLNLIDLLRRLQMVLCLTLKRRRYASQTPRDRATLLENILRADCFKPFAGNNFEVVEVQDGREWRRRTEGPDASSLVKPMDHKFLKLPDYSLLEDIPDNCFDLGSCEEIIDEPRQFLLVIHPEGPDNIELFEVWSVSRLLSLLLAPRRQNWSSVRIASTVSRRPSCPKHAVASIQVSWLPTAHVMHRAHCMARDDDRQVPPMSRQQ